VAKVQGKINRKKRSQLVEVWERLCSRRLAVVAMVVCAIFVLVAIFSDVLVPYNYSITPSPKEKFLLPGSPGHLLGTDNLGRDLLARVIHGTRSALQMGIISSFASLIIGAMLGCLCAMYGGKLDFIVMRIVDILSCVPGMVISLSLCAALGQGTWQLITALTISGMSGHIKMIRSVALKVSKMDFVESAVALGAKPLYIVFRHLFPNLTSIMITNGTTSISGNIMAGATLGFIGLGIKPPMPEWGGMLNTGLNFMMNYPHLVFVPGIALCVCSLFFSTLGDCLRDAFDPQLKGKA
jgi:peptide/nickel transport system permease protein